MDIKQLKFLCALDETRHFGQAAARCHVTQPTLSMRLRSLEEELGLELVRRSQRFEGFTEAGERVLAWARSLLAAQEGLYAEAAACRGQLVGTLRLGVVPVINENDTVVTDEIRFGDNDTLAALVANLVEADLLVILTDRDGMFDADPRNNPDAQLIYEARADDPQLDAVAGGSAGALGRGGMQTKLRAARLAARSGGHTVIVGGRIERVLDRLRAGERLGTLLTPDRSRKAARKQWLAGHLQMRGTLVLDDGAVKAVSQDHKSLLPVGVKAVQGSFRRGEMVVCVDQGGREVARGLVNYSALEAQKILGQPTDAIEALLGYVDGPELVHRDNLVLV